MYKNRGLTIGPLLNISNFSNFLVGDQRLIPHEFSESIHRQSWWGENISVIKYVWCIQHKICHQYHTLNCFPWFVFYEKCMCCCAWDILRSQTSVRLGRNQSTDPRWGIIYLHWDAFGFQTLTWHWIKWRAEDSSLTWGASYIIELSMRIHKIEPRATINLPLCRRLWHWSWKYSDKSIIITHS